MLLLLVVLLFRLDLKKKAEETNLRQRSYDVEKFNVFGKILTELQNENSNPQTQQ